MKLLALGLSIALGGAVSVAVADDVKPMGGGNLQAAAFTPPVADWKYDDLYKNGLSFRKLIDDIDLVGTDGKDIGDIEDLLIGADGKVKAMIADIGGFLGIGAPRVVIPLSQLQFVEKDKVQVAITHDAATKMTMVNPLAADALGREVVRIHPDASFNGMWRLTALLDEDATFGDRTKYGDVHDFILSPASGDILAVVVKPGGVMERDYYAYPFAGFDVATGTYQVPYTKDEITRVQKFDYDLLD